MPAADLRVLFWPIGDLNTASTRHRLFHLLPHLGQLGIRGPILQGGKTSLATALRALTLAPQVDCVFLQKKLLPSWYLSVLRRLAKRIAFDFDDALYAPRSRPLPEHLALVRRLKPKLDEMIAAADLVVAGNEVLAGYAGRFGVRVAVIPTAYDAQQVPIKEHRQANPTVIGWIGSEGTLLYLDMLVPALARLAQERPGQAVLRVISNAPFQSTEIDGLVENVQWTLEGETRDVLTFDIGVMPLLDDEWSRGKCGFKALQMMAYGLPVVASPVGANREIIQDGENGYLAEGDQTWVERLMRLMARPSLRRTIGRRGRATVIERYSVEAAAANLASALLDACRDGKEKWG